MTDTLVFLGTQRKYTYTRLEEIPSPETLFDSLIVKFGLEATREYLEDLENLMEGEPRMQELFGEAEELPEDEWVIVWDSKLTHKGKASKLKALRASKAAKKIIPLSTPESV